MYHVEPGAHSELPSSACWHICFLSSQSSHILKVTKMENLPSPKRKTSLLIQEYSFLSLSRVKFLLSPVTCHVSYIATFWSLRLFGLKTLTKGQRNTFSSVHNPNYVPLTEHKWGATDTSLLRFSIESELMFFSRLVCSRFANCNQAEENSPSAIKFTFLIVKGWCLKGKKIMLKSLGNKL